MIFSWRAFGVSLLDLFPMSIECIKHCLSNSLCVIFDVFLNVSFKTFTKPHSFFFQLVYNLKMLDLGWKFSCIMRDFRVYALTSPCLSLNNHANLASDNVFSSRPFKIILFFGSTRCFYIFLAPSSWFPCHCWTPTYLWLVYVPMPCWQIHSITNTFPLFTIRMSPLQIRAFFAFSI